MKVDIGMSEKADSPSSLDYTNNGFRIFVEESFPYFLKETVMLR